MQYIFMILAVLGITAVDQISKYLVMEQIALRAQVDVIPGLFHLTHVHNTGAAFSSFQGMRWMFVGIFLVLTAVLLFEYFKKPMPFATFDRFCLAAIYGGALGNVIDRVRLGYVVDMICVDFINFPVFNVADCFITCGCFLLLAHLIFFNKEFWKEETK